MNRYDTEKKLGEGAFGHVYLCRSRSTKQPVVQKEVDLSLLRDENERAKALSEVNVLDKFRKFSHPNIVEGKGYIHFDDVLYIYMEYCEGGCLDDDIASRQKESRFYDDETLLQYSHQIVSGLGHMHKHGIVHRSLKPENVLLASGGILKLTDFGLGALLSSEANSARTSAVSTRQYTAPEIFEGKEYDSNCDIWSFGTILYELMTLSPAFAAVGQAEEHPDHLLIKKIIRGEYSPLDDRCQEPLKALVQLLLNTEPSMRPHCKEIAALSFIHNRKVDAGSMKELETLSSKYDKQKRMAYLESQVRNLELELNKKDDEMKTKFDEFNTQLAQKVSEISKLQEESRVQLKEKDTELKSQKESHYQLQLKYTELQTKYDRQAQLHAETTQKACGEQEKTTVDSQKKEDNLKRCQEELQKTQAELKKRLEEIKTITEKCNKLARELVAREAKAKTSEDLALQLQKELDELKAPKPSEPSRHSRIGSLKKEPEIPKLSPKPLVAEAVKAPASQSPKDDPKSKKEIERCRKEFEEDKHTKKYKWTMLHYVCSRGNASLVGPLIEKGEDIHAKDKDNWTPLHWASIKGHLEVVKALLDHKAEINAKATNNLTPLYLANIEDHVEVVRLLLQRGADVNARTSTGTTPLSKATSPAMRLLLQQYGAV